MNEHVISKALEIWTLQNLLDGSIILGIVAMGLALIQQYFKSLERFLSLKVSIELWNIVSIVLVDISLAFVVITGYMVLNPDIMADIKIAIPFVPIATILFTIALFMRLFHGGHRQDNPNFTRSIWIMATANFISMIGFTFVMEAASGEYLENHPSAFWSLLKTQFRSNANLELSQITFWICFPILMIVFIWGFISAVKQLKNNGASHS